MFDPPIQKYKERWRAWANKDEELVKLRNQLLNIGGNEVVPTHEPDIDLLLSDGQVFDPLDIVQYNMRPSHCHQNCRYLYQNNPAVTEIATGWALSNDSLWRQHSWGMRGDEIAETTKPRETYFGVILRGEYLDEFIRTNI